MASSLEQEQDDIVGRLNADALMQDVSVLEQRKGVIESDIERALNVLNEKGGKIGVCVIVLLPELVPADPEAPGPEYFVRPGIQVVESPTMNRGEGGTGKSAELVAERVRQLFHATPLQTGTLTFDGMQPIEMGADKSSYVVNFRRRAIDSEYPRVGNPFIDPDEGDAPQNVAITCATGGAAIYYTLDGSYPSSKNPAALLYEAPIEIAAACVLRAAAEKAGLQQSNVMSAVFT